MSKKLFFSILSLLILFNNNSYAEKTDHIIYNSSQNTKEVKSSDKHENDSKHYNIEKDLLNKFFSASKCLPGTPKFICAAKVADAATIKKMISSGADINITDKDGRTPLMVAVMERTDLDVIDELISAELDKKGKISISVLAAAVSSDEASFSKEFVVKKLIDNGVDVNERTEFGFTPLMIAASGINSNVVNLLIKSGADINAKIKKGEYPEIAQDNHQEQYYKQKLLIDFMTEYNEQLSPLSIAIETNLNNESIAIANILYKAGAEVNFEEYTDICISRLQDIDSPKIKHHIHMTDDEEYNKILRAAERRLHEYLNKCKILIDAGIIAKDNSGNYTAGNKEISKHWGWAEKNKK